MNIHARSATLAVALALALGGRVLASSPNGVAGAMPAYYDGRLFLINFKELPPAAEQVVLARNPSVNTIFTSEAVLPDGSPFVAVLDAIQGDGFNPLWLEVEIEFQASVTPYQLLSDDDVAAAAAQGDITLSSEGEVYRCSVIGRKSESGGGSPNGRAGSMPAYYDDALFTINFMELPDDAAEAVLEHNRSVNVIYMSDAGLPDGSPFVAVLDAIQGDGFNPLWLEVQIAFNPGFTPRQLTGDDAVLDAVASGEITLSSEDEVYRCSVIGPRK